MTIAPDQGMALLRQKMAGWQRRLGPQPGDGQGKPAATETAEPDPDGLSIELRIMARLAAALDRNSDQMEAGRRPRIPWEAIHMVDIFPQANNAAGTLDDPDRWGPHDGFAWQVAWMTFTLGAGTTQVSVYRDVAASHDLIFQTVSSALWEPHKTVLMPRQRIVVVSVGGGVTAAGQAEEVAIEWLPEHLL